MKMECSLSTTIPSSKSSGICAVLALIKKKKSFFAVYRNRYRKPEPIQMQRTKYHVVPHPNWYFYDTFPSPKNWDHCGGGSEKIMSQRNRKLAVREYLLEMLEKLHP